MRAEDDAILAARLVAQKLARPSRTTPAALVAWFGAVQAQEYGPARWALGQRATNFTDRDVAAAFDAGEILRTHVMRPTWHFVAPDDIRWLQELTGPRVRAGSASVLRANELDARLLTRAKNAIVRALGNGSFLTRQELRAALARARIDASGQRLAYIVMDAELDALICSGPRRGKQFTYALVDERAPGSSAKKEEDEALGELARRYFRSHGPATIRDFVWWSGLTVGRARRAIDVAHLQTRTIGGTAYWSTGRGRTASVPRNAVHLLPIYDEYVNAYRDRGVLFEAGPPTEVAYTHYLIVDGRYAGTWSPAREDRDQVIVAARRPLTRTQQVSLRKAIERHTDFHGAR